MNLQTLSPPISPNDLSDHLVTSRDSLLLVDVRPSTEFTSFHTEGGLNIPLERLIPNESHKSRSQGKTLILVCSDAQEAKSAQHELTEAGWEDTRVLTGGIEAWTSTGHLVHKDENDLFSLDRQIRVLGLLALISALLSYYIHPLLFLLPAFAGAGLAFGGITDTCGMTNILTRMP
ncbi:MAG: rhodanese-like domain-containing protein [Roseibacillus sp.]